MKGLRLWKNADLATGEHVALLPCSLLSRADIHNSSGVEEDMKSNESTWILGNIANHLTAGDAPAPKNFCIFTRPEAFNQDELRISSTPMDTRISDHYAVKWGPRSDKEKRRGLKPNNSL